MSRHSLSVLYPRAFVTGASSGLGQAFVRMLLDEGVEVWGTSRDVARLSLFSDEGRFHPVCLDLDQPAEAERAFREAAEAAGGAFDLVVMNAGYGVFAPFTSTDFGVWQRQLEAMVLVVARLSHLALAQMRTRERGCLVQVSSIAAELPIAYLSAYNMSKAALSALSQSLDLETELSGIRVLDFRPGDHRTGFNKSIQSGGVPAHPALEKVWTRLESIMADSPAPSRAAQDLRRALLRGRRGTLRSGGFFQTILAPAFMAIAPDALRRRLLARYFDCR